MTSPTSRDHLNRSDRSGGSIVTRKELDADALALALIAIERKDHHTATHEAGHGVIARVLTLMCGGATIRTGALDDDGRPCSGRTDIGLHPECDTEWRRRGKVRGANAARHAKIIAVMAGAEAEVELLGGQDDERGDLGDRIQIDSLLRRSDYPTEALDRIEARLRAMARMLVRRHRDRIQRVAEALEEHEHLPSRDIDLIARRSVSDIMDATITDDRERRRRRLLSA